MDQLLERPNKDSSEGPHGSSNWKRATFAEVSFVLDSLVKSNVNVVVIKLTPSFQLISVFEKKKKPWSLKQRLLLFIIVRL